MSEWEEYVTLRRYFGNDGRCAKIWNVDPSDERPWRWEIRFGNRELGWGEAKSKAAAMREVAKVAKRNGWT